MKARVGRLSVRYEVHGPAGAPWVVLSNSLATSLEMWDDQAAALSASYRVLRYDQRGHGETSAPAGPYRFDDLVSDLEALLDALRIERAHLVGLSMGGTTVLGLAQRWPERVASLVICDTTASSTPQSGRQWAERAAVAAREGMSALVEPTVARWFPAETIASGAPQVDKVRKMIAATPVPGFTGCAAALSDVDYAAGIAAVPSPTLFTVGERDGELPAAMRSLHERLPGSRFTQLPGAGHLSNLDAPGAFNSAVEAFLSASGGK